MPEETGRYQKITLLGKGGMGEVWEALDAHTGRTVALKLLTSAALLDPELRERFLREMRLAAEIENPYVVAVYDFAATPQPYIAMRLIRGITLAEEIRIAPLNPARAVDIVQQIASALAAAHAKGLRHRDVKPSNIMLERGHRQGHDHAYLFDWGIAHRIDTADPEITRGGQIVGTPSYIAPERLLGTQSDHRADIYSLAVVLYQALTGKLPFGETGMPFPLRAHLFDPPRGLPPTIPAELRRVVEKGLAKEPDQRYASAADFGEEAWAALNPAGAEPSRLSRRDVSWPAGGGVLGAAAGVALASAGLLDSTSALWALPALTAAGAFLGWGVRPGTTGTDDTTRMIDRGVTR